MAKNPSVQTVAATAKTLKKVSPTLSAEEERALRMRNGVGLQRADKLEQKHGGNATLASKLAEIELMAFKTMGQKIYGMGKHETTVETAPRSAAQLAAQGQKAKIIKALKKS